jgi:hypothetical protein
MAGINENFLLFIDSRAEEKVEQITETIPDHTIASLD